MLGVFIVSRKGLFWIISLWIGDLSWIVFKRLSWRRFFCSGYFGFCFYGSFRLKLDLFLVDLYFKLWMSFFGFLWSVWFLIERRKGGVLGGIIYFIWFFFWCVGGNFNVILFFEERSISDIDFEVLRDFVDFFYIYVLINLFFLEGILFGWE